MYIGLTRDAGGRRYHAARREAHGARYEHGNGSLFYTGVEFSGTFSTSSIDFV